MLPFGRHTLYRFSSRSRKHRPIILLAGGGLFSYTTYFMRKRQTKSLAALQDFKNDVHHTATLNVAVWQIPHDSKRDKGGEDTYFISEEGTAMGVFDGVGGWSESGVDPREFAYRLAMGCKSATDEQYLSEPDKILQFGYDKVKDVVGSCTAVVGVVTGTQFNVVNLGDSGFRIYRNGKIVYGSKEQQHTFNMPLQLGYGSDDLPSHADKYKFNLLDGDIVMFGTDGVFDNLYDNIIAQVITRNKDDKAQQIAKSIAQEAYETSMTIKSETPFSDNAKRFGIPYEGGKPDDITVLVAKFTEIYNHAKL